MHAIFHRLTSLRNWNNLNRCEDFVSIYSSSSLKSIIIVAQCACVTTALFLALSSVLSHLVSRYKCSQVAGVRIDLRLISFETWRLLRSIRHSSLPPLLAPSIRPLSPLNYNERLSFCDALKARNCTAYLRGFSVRASSSLSSFDCDRNLTPFDWQHFDSSTIYRLVSCNWYSLSASRQKLATHLYTYYIITFTDS